MLGSPDQQSGPNGRIGRPARSPLPSQAMAQLLVGGDKLPPLEATDLDGNPVDITASVAGHWAAILLYRGDW